MVREESNVRSNKPRRSWLAVWRWRWWVWVMLIPLIPIAYLLSYAPVFYLLTVDWPSWNYNSVLNVSPPANHVYFTIYAPAAWLKQNSQLYRDFYSYELAWLDCLFGPYFHGSEFRWFPQKVSETNHI